MNFTPLKIEDVEVLTEKNVKVIRYDKNYCTDEGIVFYTKGCLGGFFAREELVGYWVGKYTILQVVNHGRWIETQLLEPFSPAAHFFNEESKEEYLDREVNCYIRLAAIRLAAFKYALENATLNEEIAEKEIQADITRLRKQLYEIQDRNRPTQ